VDLRCENCGYVEGVAEDPARAEAVLDFTLPTRQSQRWAEAERRFTCGQCGAGAVLPVGATSQVCPFCGSAALVAAPETELLPPQGVPMGWSRGGAGPGARLWGRPGAG
jgi:DNA-directed RNA polymerase subunit RPC12/RpoP